MKNYLYILFLCIVIVCCKKETRVAYAENESDPPNVIYILADDLGYGDVSSMNPDSKIKTIHIDALANEGMIFTDAHSSSSLCTPTRYGILTGRYAWRTRLKKGVLWSYDKPLIHSNRLTLASLLKKHGYNTACIGKWHLGLDWAKDTSGSINFNAEIQNTPTSLGFDEFYGITASLDIPPYFYISDNRITAQKIDSIDGTTGKGFWRKGPIGNDFKHENVLEHLTKKAVNYIDRKAKENAPFFLYFPLPAPHTPILPNETFQGKSKTNAYGDFVLMVDDVVKQISQSVKDKNIQDNTIIVFTSDNGSSPMADFQELESLGHYSNYHFRGHKADIYEGGHRIPFILTWPKQVKNGSRSDQTICLTDFMATMASILNDSLPDNAAEDSFDLLPIITDESKRFKREATVHHSNNGSFSIRQDHWKLIFAAGSGGWSYPTPKDTEKLDLPKLQLYDLNSDIKEQFNVVDQHPEIVEKMTTLMNSYIQNGRSTAGSVQENDVATKLYLD